MLKAPNLKLIGKRFFALFNIFIQGSPEVLRARLSKNAKRCLSVSRYAKK